MGELGRGKVMLGDAGSGLMRLGENSEVREFR